MERDELRRKRNGLRCDYEDPGDDSPEATGNGRYRGIPPRAPCWSEIHEPSYTDYHSTTGEPIPVAGDSGPSGGDLENWCDTCKERDGVHRAYLVAVRKAGALQAALYRAAKRITGVG